MTKLFLLTCLLAATTTKAQQTQDLVRALSGKMGCGIVTAKKDTAPRILIRCGGSRMAGAPLVLVDGMVGDTAVLRGLDPNQVFSVQVIKGKEASALYGTQGAQGVIVVQTRKVKVVDAEDAQPLQGVSVAITGHGNENFLVSGKEGRLNWLPAKKGAYRLHLTAVGYQPLDTLLQWEGKPVQLRLHKQYKPQDTVVVRSLRTISCKLSCCLRGVVVHSFQPETRQPAPVPSLLVYPNPVSVGSSLQFSMEEAGLVEMLSLNGQVVYSQRVATGKRQSVQLKVPLLSAAPYLLRLTPASGKPAQATTFIVQ